MPKIPASASTPPVSPVSKPPAQPPKTEISPQEKPETPQPQDKVKTPVPTGRAEVVITLKLPIDEQIAAWDKAAKGTPIPHLQARVKDGENLMQAMVKDPEITSRYDQQQKEQIVDFFRALLDYDRQGPDKQPFMSNKLINIFSEGVGAKGLTWEQLDMIAEGEMTAEAFKAKVKSGIVI